MGFFALKQTLRYCLATTSTKGNSTRKRNFWRRLYHHRTLDRRLDAVDRRFSASRGSAEVKSAAGATRALAVSSACTRPSIVYPFQKKIIK